MIDPTALIVIVTGAGTGIGRATARRFVAAGARVVFVGRRPEPLAEAAAGLPADRIRVQPADVADRADVESVVSSTREAFGPADVVINNAGINSRPRGVADVSYEDWDRTIAINLTGAFNMTRAALPAMRAAGAGTVINVASIAGKVATVLAGAPYSASKHGMVSLTTSINEEESGHGIRSTVICPGETETPILDQRPEPVSPERRSTMLQPDDIAECALLAATLPLRACIREMIVKPRIAYV